MANRSKKGAKAIKVEPVKTTGTVPMVKDLVGTEPAAVEPSETEPVAAEPALKPEVPIGVIPIKGPILGPIKPPSESGSVTLTVGEPVATTEPDLVIAGFTTPGIYTFSLTVTDDLGGVSEAATLQMNIQDVVIQ
jgi:hypothetical protein